MPPIGRTIERIQKIATKHCLWKQNHQQRSPRQVLGKQRAREERDHLPVVLAAGGRFGPGLLGTCAGRRTQPSEDGTDESRVAGSTDPLAATKQI
jgi:hypothetical protein